MALSFKSVHALDQELLGYCVICHAPKTVFVSCSCCNQPLVLRCAKKNHKSWFKEHNCR